MPMGTSPNFRDVPANPIVPIPPAALPPADPGLAERQAGSDFWKHVTLAPASTLWNSLPARIDFSRATPARAVTIYAPAGVELVIGLGRDCTAADYDLYHPGGGFLEERTMPVDFITVYPLAGVAPAASVEVWGRAGSLVL